MMITLDPRAAAEAAVGPETRPATAILFDSADARLVVFRIKPGQAVAPHRSPSTVILTVLEGAGFVSDANGEVPCKPGDMVCYSPDELHGMRATDTEFRLLATITPRPGNRAAVEVLGRNS